MPEVKFQKVEYLKLSQPPTLKQFLINRAVKEASNQTRGVNGVIKVDGQIMPKSAAMMKGLKGMTADMVLEIHPEWRDEYPQFVKEWRAKNQKS